MDVVAADDSEVTRRLLTSTIERCGHRAIPAADGGAAWEAFERCRPALIILDWQMPVIDGLELCRRIRGVPAGADVFVLMVTGRDATTGLLDALAAGVDDYMTKPVAPADLEARLRIAERRIEQTSARRAAEAALADAQRLAGIGEVALALQHEINNPLMALLTHARLLTDEVDATPPVREQCGAIADQARRIADVVRRLGELKDARSVEYVNGARMTDLRASERPRAPGRRGRAR